MHHLSQHLSGRLIEIIESRADELARETVAKLRANPRTSSYARLNDRELDDRVREVFENLGRWLWEKTDAGIQRWYNKLGEERCDEGIALKEVLWALVVTKQQLTDLVDEAALADLAIEMYRKQECDRIIGQFFDRAAYFAAEGYEREARLQEGVVAEAAVARWKIR